MSATTEERNALRAQLASRFKPDTLRIAQMLNNVSAALNSQCPADIAEETLSTLLSAIEPELRRLRIRYAELIDAGIAICEADETLTLLEELPD